MSHSKTEGRSKRNAVERMVADAEVKVSWGRVIGRANARLGKPTATAASEPPKPGWAKVVAQLNAQLTARR